MCSLQPWLLCFTKGDHIPETSVWLFSGADWHLVCASAGESLRCSVSHRRSYRPPQRSASPTCRKVKEKFPSKSELLSRWKSRGHNRQHGIRRNALEETLRRTGSAELLINGSNRREGGCTSGAPSPAKPEACRNAERCNANSLAHRN